MPTPLTVEEIRSLLLLCEGATREPWCHVIGHGVGGTTREGHGCAVCVLDDDGPPGPDMRMLVATRNALPSLLAMASRLLELESAMDFLEATGGRDVHQEHWRHGGPRQVTRLAVTARSGGEAPALSTQSTIPCPPRRILWRSWVRGDGWCAMAAVGHGTSKNHPPRVGITSAKES